jgi:hypothetical protein
LETNGLIKAGLKIPDWPIHKDNRRALVDTDNAAQAFVETNDIPGP